jgi:hypothetical protein
VPPWTDGMNIRIWDPVRQRRWGGEYRLRMSGGVGAGATAIEASPSLLGALLPRPERAPAAHRKSRALPAFHFRVMSPVIMKASWAGAILLGIYGQKLPDGGETWTQVSFLQAKSQANGKVGDRPWIFDPLEAFAHFQIG